MLGFVTLTAVFGSSIFTAAIGSVAQNYGISGEVGILGVSLYVLGFAVGPVLCVVVNLTVTTLLLTFEADGPRCPSSTAANTRS